MLQRRASLDFLSRSRSAGCATIRDRPVAALSMQQVQQALCQLPWRTASTSRESLGPRLHRLPTPQLWAAMGKLWASYGQVWAATATSPVRCCVSPALVQTPRRRIRWIELLEREPEVGTGLGERAKASGLQAPRAAGATSTASAAPQTLTSMQTRESCAGTPAWRVPTSFPARSCTPSSATTGARSSTGKDLRGSAREDRGLIDGGYRALQPRREEHQVCAGGIRCSTSAGSRGCFSLGRGAMEVSCVLTRRSDDSPRHSSRAHAAPSRPDLWRQAPTAP